MAARFGLGHVDPREVELEHRPGDRLGRGAQGGQLSTQDCFGLVQRQGVASNLCAADKAPGPVLGHDRAQGDSRGRLQRPQRLGEGLQSPLECAFDGPGLGQRQLGDAEAVMEPRPVHGRMVRRQEVGGEAQHLDTLKDRPDVAFEIAQPHQGRGADLLGAGQGQGMIGAVQGRLGPIQIDQGRADQVGFAQAGPAGDEELGAIAPQPGRSMGLASTLHVEAGEGPLIAGDHGLDLLDPRLGQGAAGGQGGAKAARAGRVGRLSEQELGGGVEPIFTEQVGAQEGDFGLLADRPPKGVVAVLLAGQARPLFGAGSGLAQRGRVAGAAGELAPDLGGADQPLGAVLNPDASGGDVGGAAFILEQGQVQQLEQDRIAGTEPVTAGVRRKEPLQFASDLEH